MKQIPFILIYSRIVIGLIIPILTYLEVNSVGSMIVILMTLGLLTDVFDGIIARNLGVATEKLRIWDSSVDQFFWLSVIITTFYLRWDVIPTLFLPIGILIILEGFAYLISFIKFSKPIATHSILAKFWTLSLLTFLIELLIYNSHKSFWFCFVLGAISRLEIILIIIKLKEWVTDVPSIRAVEKINNGEEVKKWKLFN